ncbi:hypothetical protein QQS21_002675 [Conoideocrella luteorostrata]|uniref:LrgB-like protein n=1 Tax=Conoideocrella luteorostrata TaxID=1105319 RepID=A0AAJ0CXT8_9HYPO|nr:hypothetical protein QQS21_002675 [Conoideocrella luteorostrata]
MTFVCNIFRSCDDFYRRGIKAGVDFINAQLGVAFSVPIIMLNHVLGIRDIGYIVVTSAVTNILSWAIVFLLSLSGLLLLSTVQSYTSTQVRCYQSRSSISPQREQNDGAGPVMVHPSESLWQYLTPNDSSKTSGGQSSSSRDQNICGKSISTSNSEKRDESLWYLLKSNGYLFVCLVGIIAIGVPIDLTLRDSRMLDGFVLWLCWIISIRLQRMVKSISFPIINLRSRHTLAIMINPVLVTTMLMLGYTRMKGTLGQGGGITSVLESFSSGTPLYSILTAMTTSSSLPDNPSCWFGAGDVALSLLECGIVAWGFKLYECRHQLFSISGVAILLFCSVAAAGNVFLSVLLAATLGLDKPEALAFAARSSTLALAKPAVKTLGGNLALNATLVVSNGILGQLLYPFLLEKLAIPTFDQSDDNQMNDKTKSDSPITIAAGTTIGINGAAMGVSYLYEVESRAAPYAALSMTIFGVMTVVFTTLEPFKSMVLQLASR